MFAADGSHVNSDCSPVCPRPTPLPNCRSRDADVAKNAGRSGKRGNLRRDLLLSLAN